MGLLLGRKKPNCSSEGVHLIQFAFFFFKRSAKSNWLVYWERYFSILFMLWLPYLWKWCRPIMNKVLFIQIFYFSPIRGEFYFVFFFLTISKWIFYGIFFPWNIDIRCYGFPMFIHFHLIKIHLIWNVFIFFPLEEIILSKNQKN